VIEPLPQPSTLECRIAVPGLPANIDRQSFEQSFAERLLRLGKLDAASLERALKARSSQEDRLETILSRLGLVSEADSVAAAAAELGLAVVGPQDYPDAPAFEGRISSRFLRRALAVPLAIDDGGVVVAMADPLDGYTIKAIEHVTGKPVSVRIGTPTDIEASLERLYGNGAAGVAAVDATQDEADAIDEDDEGRLRDLASEAPVIRLVNQLIGRAVEQRASDIHIEPFASRLLVRYRVDGLMREAASPPTKLHAAIVSRVKIMAKMNIAERRLPQDGRIRIAIRGQDYDLRVATVPALHGEAVTLRILDRKSLVTDFSALGFDPATMERFVELLHRPQGILLATGPTGSGKTTTLYACLSLLNTPDRKLVTVEEPIEYQLEGVNQVQVRPKIGLTFPEVLRTFLRHNPNVIMVGEMRDLVTAQIAIQAALTGHLVLSTLHTNNAASSITRLLDMKVEDYLITSTVNGVIAQRLVRRLCPSCRRPYQPSAEIAARLAGAADPSQTLLYAATGCEACGGSGYSGQVALVELLVVSDRVRDLVLKHAEALEIQRVAIGEGMRTMYDDGVRKALAGITTMEEVLRVTRDVV
jgi:general secretion pathway protein E